MIRVRAIVALRMAFDLGRAARERTEADVLETTSHSGRYDAGKNPSLAAFSCVRTDPEFT